MNQKIKCFFILFAISFYAFGSQVQTITILHTSDVHGHLINWDYFGNSPYNQGLAAVSTRVNDERSRDPDLLLLDGGDTIQGSPLAFYFNRLDTSVIHPMAAAMNAMRYDAMVIGNHEYNYGQNVLNRFIRQCHFPVISANIRTEKDQIRYKPYLITTVKGIRIGILGLTTTGIPVWEKPDHIAGMTFEDPIAVAKAYVDTLKSKQVQIIIALVHSGPHQQPENAQRNPALWKSARGVWKGEHTYGMPGINFVIPLAQQVPEIDVILSGHMHLTIPEATVNGVLITQPSRWARGVSKITIKLDGNSLIEKQGIFLSCEDIKPDSSILTLAAPYQEKTMNYVRTPIGEITDDFPGGMEARTKDGPLADLINDVQIKMAENAGYHADISCAAVFNLSGGFSKGPVTLLDVYRNYQYDNTLTVLEINGKILKKAIEHTAAYWKKPEPGDSGPVPSGNMPGYNWDMFTGITYQINLTRPVGERVTRLEFMGNPVQPDQTLLLVLNNYRAGGGGGFMMYRQTNLIWESTETVRDGMAGYIRQKQRIDPLKVYQKNWELISELDQ